jgi:AhpD family alkylhydroperoxidase
MGLSNWLASSLESYLQSTIRVLALPKADALGPADHRALDEIRAAFGAAVPPAVLHLVVPELFRAFWGMQRDTLIRGSVDRRLKELVAAGISLSNKCPYCVDAHTGALFSLEAPVAAEALARDDVDSISDPTQQALTAWARRSGSEADAAFPRTSFSAEQRAEIFGTAFSFHYLNRVVSVFLPKSPFIGPAALRELTRRNLRRVMTPSPPPAGSFDTNLGLRLDGYTSPFDWARPNPVVARRLAVMIETTERYGQKHLPDAVRSAVSYSVLNWNGAEPPLGRAWLDTLCCTVESAHRPVAELCALVARAPSMITPTLVAASLEALRGSSEALFSAVAWSALEAARQVGSWYRLQQ